MSQQGNKFGAFKGVFTPSILSILGVIMYLRLPWIVGQAGLWATLGIVLVAHIISITTGLSVASIATDKKVETGGPYYMISRSLGLPIGGTLGLALFVGLSFSASLYVIGFSETFLTAFGYEITLNSIRLTGLITLLSVTIITFISTNLALKTQFLILAVVILSLASIFFGNHEMTPKTPLSGFSSDSLSWIALFAIFFPAVTGFTAGVSMSGDLANPKKAIPRGTIMAILVGLVVYMGLVFFFSYTVERDALVNDPAVLFNISLYSPLVVAGIWGATLSSAFGSILGAPRILQAMALDRITPKPFAKGVGKGNEPRNALVLTFTIALGGILIGDLNIIARLVSIFFIITYGFLNLTCAIENWAGSDFRPSLRIPASVSIIGAIAAFMVMVQLDFIAMIGATILLGAIFFYLKRKELKLQSGDTWAGFWSSIIKYGLLKLSATEIKDQRNWRPNIILFSGNAQARPHLISMGRTLVGKQGIFTNFQLVEEADKEFLFEKTATSIVEKDSSGKVVKTRRHTCKDIYEGILMISRIYGFTGFDPNTILMGWGRKTRNPDKFYETTLKLFQLDYNLIFYNQVKRLEPPKKKQIDLWWNGNSRNLNFGISLLKFITTDSAWRRANVRIIVINYNSAKTDSIYALVNQILDNSRLLGSVKVINNSSEKLSEVDIIKSESAETDLSILELDLNSHNNLNSWADYVNDVINLPCSSLIIEAGSGFEHINAHTTPLDTLADKEKGEDILPSLTQTIQLPGKVLLAEEVQKILIKHEELQQNFMSNSLLYAESLFTEFNKDVSSLTKKLLSSVEHSIAESNIDESSGIIYKSLSEFTFQTKSKLLQFRDTLLVNAHKGLLDALTVYLENVVNFNNKLPEKVIIKFSRAEFKTRKNDSAIIRLFKLRSRFRGLFLGWPINQKVEISKAAQLFLYSNRLDAIQDFHKQFGLTTFRLISNTRRCLVDLGKTIEQKINSQSISHINDELESIKQQTNQLHSEVLNDLKASNKKTIKALNADLQNNIQRLSFVVGKPESDYLLSPYKKLVRNKKFDHENISNTPSIWLKNIKLFANKSLLEFTLASLKHRFKIKLKKQVEELTLWANGKLSETIGEAKSILHNLATASELPDTSKISEKLNELKNPAMQERFELFFKDINDIISELPERIDVNDDNFFAEIDKGNFPESDIRTIDLRRKAQFYIGTELISNARNSMDILSDSLKETSTRVADMLRLALFNIENIISSDSSEEDKEKRKKLVDDLLKDITAQELQVKKTFEKFDKSLNQYLNQSLEPLYQLVFSKQMLDKKSKGKLRMAPTRSIAKAFQPISKFIDTQLVNVLYSQSEGIMLAQKLTNFEQEHKISNQAIQEILVYLSADSKVIKSIPFYYISLFSGSTALSKDLWVERPKEQAEAERIVSRFKSGYTGALLITGNRNSGKTTLSKYIANTYLAQLDLNVVRAPKGGSTNREDFIEALQKALSIKVDPYHYLKSSPKQRVIIINDLELWWERHRDGLGVIQEIIKLIEQLGNKVFIIVNCGILAHGLIKKLLNIDAYFMGHIQCVSYDAKELKDIVLKRHQTGGLKLSLNGKSESTMSEWNYAHLFNKYFNLSGGNPGYTLQAWISNITKVVGKTIYIKAPIIPNLSHLNSISDDLWLVLLQLALHRRISADRLSKVLHQSEAQILTLLRDMQRAGLIEERFTGVFAINSLLEPHLLKKMNDKGFC